MYCIIFEPDKEPEIWESSRRWPGLISLQKAADTYVYFFSTMDWHKYITVSKYTPVQSEQVPPKYRATILILT